REFTMRNQVEQAIRGDADPEPVPIDSEREREVRQFADDTVRRRTQTHELSKIRAKLRASARGHIADAAAQLGGRRPNEYIPNSDYDSFCKGARRAINELDQEQRIGEFEHHAAVVSEPKVYGPDSPFSYYRDLSSVAVARLGPEAAADPLARMSSGDVDQSPAAAQSRLDKHC